MADKEHIDKLLEGIDAWNNWREQNPDIVPDLSQESTKLKNWSSDKIRSWEMGSNGVNLEKANLWNTDLSGAGLMYANLKGAILIQATLRDTWCINADLQNANLTDADIRGANLIYSNLEGANVSGIKYNRFAKYRGIRVATCYGSPSFKRFAQDQDFIEEFREESKWKRFLYCLWILIDCGRSFWPLLIWVFTIWLAFGSIYAAYPIPNWLSWLPQSIKDILFDMKPNLKVASDTPFTPYYFSMVTLTTLGYGDITPLNKAGEIFVTIEVTLGYLMLGLLISILANKLARRS